jgi:hypothetical protein
MNDSERLAVVETKIDAIHEDLHAIWKALERLTNRPPIWAGMLITVLSSSTVGLITVVLTR